jgi:AcrR family transcriptional regulator
MKGRVSPTDEEVRTAAEHLLAVHRDGGAYPSVSELAKHFAVNRTTFYRHFAPIAKAMLDTAGQQHTEGPKRRRPPRQDGECDQIIRRLRDENTNLRRHVELYEEHLRMLTMENAKLTEQLQQLAGITEISSRRTQESNLA